MSSHQHSKQSQLNISIDNDLRSKDNLSVSSNSYDYTTAAYTSIENTIEDIINVPENELFKHCGMEHNQYSEGDQIEIFTNIQEVNKNNNSPLINSYSSSIKSKQNVVAFRYQDNQNEFEGMVGCGDKFHFEGNDILVGNKLTETLNIVNAEKDNEKSSFSSYLNTAIEQQHSGIFVENSKYYKTSVFDRNNCQESNPCSEEKRPQDVANSDEEIKNADVANDDETPIEDFRTTNRMPGSPDPTKSEESDNDDDVIDKTFEVTNDELISNEDSHEYPEVVDFDGIDEVENEEYILDTFVRKPRRERRRIVSINDDDSDADIEVERKRLLKSPMMNDNLLSNTDNVEEDVDIELLIQNEKPGPKSKKMSTQKLKELQARALLRNAVVIPSSGKKKKCRIIDSDDDEHNSLPPYCVNIDDIGLPDMIVYNEEQSDAVVGRSILLTNVDKNSTQIENSSLYLPPIGNSVLETNFLCPMYESQLQATDPMEECPTTNLSIPSRKSGHVNAPIDTNGTPHQLGSIVQESKIVKREYSDSISEVQTAITKDLKISMDSSNQQFNKRNDVEVVDVDFPPFPSSSSSENEEEFIPNDVYFGTPDLTVKKSARGKGSLRGRPTQSSSRRVSNYQNGVIQEDRGRGTSRRGRPRRDRTSSVSNSTSSSNETDDEYQKSKARRKTQTITIVKTPSQLYHSVSLPIQNVQKQQVQRQHQRKRDRFYDKSQDIPNAIYFGDVDVPLHVLYAYGDDSDSDNDLKANSKRKISDIKFDPLKANAIRFSSQVSRGNGRTISVHSSHEQLGSESIHQRLISAYSINRRARGRPKMKSVSPSNDSSIRIMKRFFKAAGLKKVKLNRLWEGCKSNSERAAKMLELLHEKGLEGEPTLSKCKQLKSDYITKKEIEDLDPNLIIQTEGRTRRSVTRAATKRQYIYNEEIMETRTKLRNVIDSDSDFD